MNYQSTKKQDLKVVTKAKPKSNVLDKMPGKKAAGGRDDSSMDTSEPAAPPPPAGMTASQAQKMEELVNEVNKLKAIVLKHEVRIRDLEKKVDVATNGETGDGETAKNGDAH